jgi:hypothetical protein
MGKSAHEGGYEQRIMFYVVPLQDRFLGTSLSSRPLRRLGWRNDSKPDFIHKGIGGRPFSRE